MADEAAVQQFKDKDQTNTSTLTGNLGDDPKLGWTKANPPQPVVTLSIANSVYAGESAPARMGWFTVVQFGPRAIAVYENCKKGREITATGTLVSRTYDDVTSPEAVALQRPIRRNKVELRADKIVFGPRPFAERDPEGFAAQMAASAAARGETPAAPAAAAAPALTPEQQIAAYKASRGVAPTASVAEVPAAVVAEAPAPVAAPTPAFELEQALDNGQVDPAAAPDPEAMNF